MKMIPKPNDVTWTDDQWKAISAEGNNILVAAAAGSGKTAVLVERIIRKVSNQDHPIDVDRLLVVTFTNATAAEMRHRIGEAIEKKLNADPRSLHLRRQLSLLHRASISTLHSFCMNVVRKYYYEVNTDPNFRIVDATEGELIREEILDHLFEQEYGSEENQEFFHLVDQYSGDRSDDKLRSLVLDVFQFSRSHPQPNRWLDSLIDTYQLSEFVDIDSLPWTGNAIVNIREQLVEAMERMKKAFQLTQEINGPLKYADTFQFELNQLRQLLQATTWEEYFHLFQSIQFDRIPTITKKDPVDELLKDQAKTLRTEAKELVIECKANYFQRSSSEILAELMEMSPTIIKLIEVVKSFSVIYMEEKRNKGILDFSDLEHLCLEILTDDELLKGGQIKPSKAALEYVQHFHEIFVDEYQDTNLVQETILQLISNHKNLFMVGDVKQSIYRFRLAEPTLFMSKYKQFDLNGEGDGLRIDLAKNFRSREGILNTTNFLFRQLMDESVGEIEYNKSAELALGNEDYPPSNNVQTELKIINKGEPLLVKDPADEIVDVEEELETSQLEARVMIQQIKGLIESHYQIYDKDIKQLRQITYRDIVILMRSMPWAETIMEECKKTGVPVYAELTTGYFDAIEIRVMMSLLKVIDNPYQDIPLASVLRSAIVQFDEKQLAHIRILDRDSSYFEALKKASVESLDSHIQERSKLFLTQLNVWRKKARSGSLSELIWQLFRDTGFFDFVGGMPGGKQRQANLRALYDRARSYESTSFRGLFRFLRFVERMQERGDDLGTARALGEQEDVVRIMTIHKSKGLEFPIVFILGMNKMFNQQDLHGDYLLHKELGLGSKFIDPKLRVAFPTIPQQVIKEQIKSENIAEEMRVLYVALTRAKEKLYLIGTVNEANKSIEKWIETINHSTWLLPNMNRKKARRFLDWIGPAIVRHRTAFSLMTEDDISTLHVHEEVKNDPSLWDIQIIEKNSMEELAAKQPNNQSVIEEQLKLLEPIQIYSTYKDKVKLQLEWKYRHQDATSHQAKQTVSDLKRHMQDPYSDHTIMDGSRFSKFSERPKFLQKKAMSPSEKGTLMHTVMQHVTINPPPTLSVIKADINSLVVKEILLEEEAAVIDPKQILAFFQSPIGKRMSQSKQIFREIPFSFGISALEAYDSWEQNEDNLVFVQGMIDCVFRDTNGKLVLIDYKTDTVTGKFSDDVKVAMNHFKTHYRYQVELYRRALIDSWKEPIDECYLYFFDGNHVLKLDME